MRQRKNKQRGGTPRTQSAPKPGSSDRGPDTDPWDDEGIPSSQPPQDLPTRIQQFLSTPPRPLALLCALISFLLYSNTHRNGWAFDDVAVRDNPDVIGSAPLSDVWKNDFWGEELISPRSHKSYRPLTVLTYRVNAAVAGKDGAGWFHVWNNVLNALAVCAAVWAVIAVGGATPSDVARPAATGDKESSAGKKKGKGRARPATASSMSGTGWDYYLAASALLFTFHPVHTEAVATVVGRSDVLAGLLSFCSMGCHGRCLKYSDSASSRREGKASLTSTVYYLAAIALGWTAALTKETGIAVLAVCGAQEIASVWIPAMLAKSSRKPPLTLSIARFVGLALSGVAYLALRSVINGPDEPFGIAIASFQDNPLLWTETRTSYVLTALHIQALYVWKMIYPFALSCEYGFDVIPIVESFGDPRNLLTVLWLAGMQILVLLGIQTARSDRRDPRILIGLAWIVGPLLPASHIIPIGTVMAERLLYMPSLGYVMLVGVALQAWVDKFILPLQKTGKGHKRRKATLLLSSILLAVFAFKVVDRNAEWKNNVTLFQSTYLSHPRNVKAVNAHVKNLIDEGDFETAYTASQGNYLLLKDLRMDQLTNLADFNVYQNLAKAMVLSDAGGRDYDKAYEILDEAAKIGEHRNHSQRFDWGVYVTKAELLTYQREFENAEIWSRKALAISNETNPLAPEPHCQVGVILATLGMLDEGVEHLERCVELSAKKHDDISKYVGYVMNLGKAYYSSKRWDEAEEMLTKSQSIKPAEDVARLLESIAKLKRPGEQVIA